LVERVAVTVYSEMRAAGGVGSFLAIREVVENLIHAGFRGATVSVLPGGREVVVTDQGSGIPDPGQALRPGFSTAPAAMREVIRGVGSGLAIAAECMERSAGEIAIEGNLGHGAAVTLRFVGAEAQHRRETGAGPATTPRTVPPRRTQVLLLMADGREVGPSEIAEHVGASLTTAFRDLAQLERDGYVNYIGRGKRVISDQGREYVTALLDSPPAFA
jgi:anti-sigma regulatory factor (Ser/Thr protein kinase)